MNLRFRHWFILIAVFSVGILAGSLIERSQRRVEPDVVPVELGDRFYATYLNGDVNQARESLHGIIQLLQKTTSPHGQAFGLFLSYSRLYALEARIGDPDAAESCFVKARYWCLRDGEIGNRTQSDLAKIMRAFTTNACIKMVDDRDKRHAGGLQANYLRARTNQNVTREP